MLCRATKKRFYNSVMVGPLTGNETVNYIGDPDKRPDDFVVITDDMLEAEAALKERARRIAADQSAGLLIQEYTNPGGNLAVSGGVDRSSDAVAHQIRSSEAGSTKPESGNAGTEEKKDSAAATAAIKKGRTKKSPKKKAARISRPQSEHETTQAHKVPHNENGDVVPADTGIES